MKRTFSTELAYVFGIVFVALGVVLMEKADFGASMVVAPAYLLYRWLSPVWSFVTFGMAEYCLQAVLLLAMCLLLRFRVSYLFSFVTAVVYGFALDAFMLLGAALPAGSVWLRVIYYALGMFFCAAGVSAMFHTYSKHIRCPDTRSKCAFQPCGQTAHFDFWDAPKPCLIFAKSPWIRGIARELNDIFAMTLFCDFEASQAAISTMISRLFTRKLAYRFLLNAIACSIQAMPIASFLSSPTPPPLPLGGEQAQRNKPSARSVMHISPAFIVEKLKPP